MSLKLLRIILSRWVTLGSSCFHHCLSAYRKGNPGAWCHSSHEREEPLPTTSGPELIPVFISPHHKCQWHSLQSIFPMLPQSLPATRPSPPTGLPHPEYSTASLASLQAPWGHPLLHLFSVVSAQTSLWDVVQVPSLLMVSPSGLIPPSPTL